MVLTTQINILINERYRKYSKSFLSGFSLYACSRITHSYTCNLSRIIFVIFWHDLSSSDSSIIFS